MDGMVFIVSSFANALSKLLIEVFEVLGATIELVEWIERELRLMEGLLEQIGQRRYVEQEQELNEWEEKLKETARDAEDVIETFVIKSVKRRRWGVLYWIDKYNLGIELMKIHKRMRDISQAGMNLYTDIVSIDVETTPGGEASSSSIASTTVVVATEKLDHILSQTTIVTGEEVIEMVERLKGEFIYLQNNIASSNLSWSRSERENVWLEEVKELCNYTESVVDNFILDKERRSKMGRLKKVLYLLADYASENEFKKQLKYIRTQIGDARHRSLTYEVGGLLDMGVEFKKTTPVPYFSQESSIILDILFLIATTHSVSRPLSFLFLINFFFMIVDERGKTSKRKSKSSLKKKKKWNGMKIIRLYIRFLFFTVIYLPIFYLFLFHHVLAMFLFMLSYLLIKVIEWSWNLWRSMDKNLKCTQRYLAQMHAFLSDTTQSAEGLNKRQRVWVDQLRVLSQYGQSLIDAYSNVKGGCLSRIKFSKDINCLLKEILDISDRKAIYCIANIQTTQPEHLPLLTPISSIQERDIENEIISEHDESSDATPAAAAASSSSYQPKRSN